MNILEQAKDIYDKCGYSDMTSDLCAYITHGYFFVTPNSLLAMKPVDRFSEIKPSQQWYINEPNAWYVHAIIGEVKKWIDFLPYDLPFIGWERGVKRHPIKWFKTKNLKRRK